MELLFFFTILCCEEFYMESFSPILFSYLLVVIFFLTSKIRFLKIQSYGPVKLLSGKHVRSNLVRPENFK